MAFIGSVIFGVTTRQDLKDGVMKRWYLRPDSSRIFFDPKRAPVAAVYHFLTAIMLYSYFIPISLYVSIEIVKVLQSIFINQDIHMYYEEADKPARAVMSSDIAIAQFRYLERLLLVHGHWCYRRISTMICYFFYKNITFGFTLFLYETYTTFSSTPAYNDWFLSLYNVFFSSLPVIALGVFDQDVSARYCLKFPLLYQEGVQNVLFSWRRILGWMFNGFYSAIIVFYLCKSSLQSQAFNHDGKTAGREILGGTMYTCIVWVVNLQLALAISYFTLIQHIVIWSSIVVWYFFITVYGELPANISTGAYKV
ncbi:PREDICTED: putative phospholipid-transporting ATPase 9, partial [Camelina sativa]|uniref:Phospholipid-transporting ATPase 9 n=1 Tax=Camelina sativa TaxID=90675 RepID=A0ABM0Y8D2_CAMSA